MSDGPEGETEKMDGAQEAEVVGGPDGATLEATNLDLVMDVELNVTLRFGQRSLSLREVLELSSGSVIPSGRFREVLWQALPQLVGDSQIVLRPIVTLLGCPLIQLCSLAKILGHAHAFGIAQGQIVLSLAVSFLRRAPIPSDCLSQILGNAFAAQ